jgi:hypothetical protein
VVLEDVIRTYANGDEENYRYVNGRKNGFAVLNVGPGTGEHGQSKSVERFYYVNGNRKI